MNTLLVGYDLNRPGQDYSSLFAAIKAAGAWWHHLDSTWLVRTSLTPVELRDRLRHHVDAGDELLVMDVTGRPAAWAGIPDSGGDWLKQNL